MMKFSSSGLALVVLWLLSGCGSGDSEPDGSDSGEGNPTTGGVASDSSTDTGGSTDIGNSDKPSNTGGTDTGNSSDSGGAGDKGQLPHAGEGAPDGWFVFWKLVTVDDAGSIVKVDQEVTEDDLKFRPNRKDCPKGVVCLEHGLSMLGFDAEGGRFHYQRRVKTSSDNQRYGTFTYSDQTVHVQYEQKFSCAHPKDKPYTWTDTDDFTARVDDDTGDLWVQDFNKATGAQWWIYRSITAEDANYTYDLYFCGSDHGRAGTCHCLCKDRDTQFLQDWTCAE